MSDSCDPMDLLGSSVHRLSRQEYWSGLPFPSPYISILFFFSFFLLPPTLNFSEQQKTVKVNSLLLFSLVRFLLTARVPGLNQGHLEFSHAFQNLLVSDMMGKGVRKKNYLNIRTFIYVCIYMFLCIYLRIYIFIYTQGFSCSV